MLGFLDSFSAKAFVIAANKGIDLKDFYDWFSSQVKWVLFIVLLGLLIVAIVKRAWLYAVGVLIGLSLIGIFILNPEALLGLSEWLGGLLNISDSE